MKIAKDFQIDAIDYASQGNAILGIRDSGKSYTASKIAEELLDANIPCIIYDPVGTWRYLKVGKPGSGFKGYPIVVVGGENGDIPLRPDKAEDIVEAAMYENISLVIDLYSMELSKADWRRIVEKSVRLLLYQNKGKSLKHIFIEEAAEFIPQRIQPGYGNVYAEIEKLARMGRNASLGFTIINQRAEEVNKAIFELCSMVLLHKQTGKNSLLSIKKWFEVSYLEKSEEILKSLSQLQQGETWVVGKDKTPVPQKINVLEKKTVHPNPKNPTMYTRAIPIDVSGFVEKLNKQLKKEEKKAETKSAAPNRSYEPRNDVSAGEVKELKEKLEAAEGRVKELEIENNELTYLLQEKNAVISEVKSILTPFSRLFGVLFNDIPASESQERERRTKIVVSPILDNSGYNKKFDIWLMKFPEKTTTGKMLRAFIDYKELTALELQTAIKAGSSGHFSNCISDLAKVKIIQKVSNGRWRLNSGL